MTPSTAIILDIVLVGLLAVTIVYAILLNRQIVRLRESRSELIELVRGLSEATAKADSSVKGLRKTAAETGDGLQKTIDKAAALRDELSFIVETGEALANRLGNTPSAPERAKPAGPAARGPARPLIDDTLAAARAEASRHDPVPASPPSRAPVEPAPRPRDASDGMSRAERELMQAIENRR